MSTLLVPLNPSIPVDVIGKGRGECIAWLEYSKEDDMIWGVAMDDTGEVWWVPNKDIRFIKNYSIGRNLDGK